MTPPLCFYLLPGATSPEVVDRASKGAPWTTTCDAASIARIRANGSKVVYRPYLPDDGLCDNGRTWGRQIGAALAGADAPWPEVIVFRNECQQADWAGTVQIAVRYLQCRAALRALGFRGWLGLGSFAVGTPDWPAWAALKAGLAGAAPDCLFLHEYFSHTVAGSAPWWALRHREAIRRGLLPATWPLFVGECGSDLLPGCPETGGRRRRGWQDRGKLSPDQMAAQLAAYRAGCAPHVEAIFIFADGGVDPNWATYRTFGTPVEAAIRATWGNPPQKGPPMLQGMDISNLQGQINWPAISPDVRFVAIKASEGTGFTDPNFADNWRNARATGRVRIAYHFARPEYGNTPEAEAAYFLARLTDLQPGDLLALDLETGTGDLSGWALAWLRAVEVAVGFKPLLYSYPDFIATRNLGTAALAAYPLWYASYRGSEPAAPGRWGGIAIWQNTDAAGNTGIPGTVDGDETALTLDQLRALGKPAPQGAPVDTALAYYEQLGVRLDPTHAVYTMGLKPLYDYWQAHQHDVQGGMPVGDLLKPGPAVAAEYEATWGGSRPAACVKLQNCVVGAYQDEAGNWHGYRANI